ncbi:hypothetical protein AA3271_2761 [Gluconobacter japonicus NBRC 3271]|nr:hypothetical protein AA3271_2761 [Gluconobacter japonicus NBRC 3271]
MTMDEPRKAARIDFGAAVDSITPRRPKIDKSTTSAAIADAAQAGFTGRSDKVNIDGRSLRKSGRTAQLNIKLRPETKAQFLERAQAFPNTEDFVRHLLSLLNGSE